MCLHSWLDGNSRRTIDRSPMEGLEDGVDSCIR